MQVNLGNFDLFYNFENKLTNLTWICVEGKNKIPEFDTFVGDFYFGPKNDKFLKKFDFFVRDWI